MKLFLMRARRVLSRLCSPAQVISRAMTCSTLSSNVKSRADVNMVMTGRTRIKIWLVLALVFVLGCATGAALDVLYHSRASVRSADARGRDMQAHFDAMRRDLNLTDEQATAIRAILDETRDEYRALRTELRPRFEEPRMKARARIRALLTPEQQQKFDAMTAQQDSKREEEEQRRTH